MKNFSNKLGFVSYHRGRPLIDNRNIIGFNPEINNIICSLCIGLKERE